MSTSILYHGWGLTEHTYLKTDFMLGVIWFHVEKKPEKRCCPECKSRDFSLAGKKVRHWKTVPIGLHPVTIVGHFHRLDCLGCGQLRWEDLGIGDPMKRYARNLGRYALGLSRAMALSDVAVLTGLSWPTIKQIVKDDLTRRASKVNLRHVRYIAIDEVSHKKGQQYFTVVLDWESGEVLHVADGRGMESLKEFFWKLRCSRAKLAAVAMDMHEPYAAAVKEYYRKPVDIVYDRFHVMKLVSKQLDEVRRQEMAQADSDGSKRYIKGQRYILLRPLEELSLNGQQRLENLLLVNRNICMAYILKEDLRSFWEADSMEEGANLLLTWICQAISTGLKPFQKLVKTILQRWDGLMAYFKHPISTGPLEGVNTKIKLLKRKAYGYRDEKFFKLRILFIHECLSKLVGT